MLRSGCKHIHGISRASRLDIGPKLSAVPIRVYKDCEVSLLSPRQRSHQNTRARARLGGHVSSESRATRILPAILFFAEVFSQSRVYNQGRNHCDNSRSYKGMYCVHLQPNIIIEPGYFMLKHCCLFFFGAIIGLVSKYLELIKSDSATLNTK